MRSHKGSGVASLTLESTSSSAMSDSSKIVRVRIVHTLLLTMLDRRASKTRASHRSRSPHKRAPSSPRSSIRPNRGAHIVCALQSQLKMCQLARKCLDQLPRLSSDARGKLHQALDFALNEIRSLPGTLLYDLTPSSGKVKHHTITLCQ